MSQKVRKTLIMIVMAALIICLMAASLTYTFTYGRYAGGKFDEESPYDDLIEFVGAREYTVRSPEELIQAIKDGYSNIVIAEDAEEPFVITEGVTDVEANLVLNLNGKVVVRNSRNPMLDVQTNVSVVLVYDSKQTGAFYNPVGSSLMASGGSLTVGSGGYESGPRAEEYKNEKDAGTLGDAANATLFARSNETNNAVSGPTKLDRSKYVSDYSLVSGVSLPTITPKTTQENGRTSVRGNVYLSSNHSDWLPADTFLVYTVEENCFIGNGQTSGGVTFTKNQLYVNAESEKVGNVTTVTASEFTKPLCNVASCDFYYYYPIDKEGNPIDTAGTADSPQDYAVIYGYWDVMALAQDDKKNETDEKGMATALKDSGLIWPYASVRMEKGEGIVRGGTFSNHFDAVNTYGIYAEGGRLSVSKNTTVDTTFTTGGEGVCIRVQSATGETTTTGGSLTISGGEFSSEIGNTIEMSGGKMNVTAGKFTKSAAKGIGSDGDDGNDGADQIANQTAIIDIEGGTLKIEGKSADSVKLTAGGAVTNPDDGTVTYSGTLQNVFGIRANGGTVTASGCTFNISGDYSAGVLSYNGTINLDDNTVINVTQSETATVLTSAGVSSEQASGDGEHPVNLSGNVTIISNGLGITARGTVNVTEGESTVTTSRGTGIYVNNGSFNVDIGAAITVNSTVKSGYSWATPPRTETTNPPGTETTNPPNIYNGVYVQGGSLESEGTLNVNFTGVQNDGHQTTGNVNTNYRNQQIKSFAVRVDGTTAQGVSIASGTILNGAQSDLTRDEEGNITGISGHSGVGGGILVKGGTVTLGDQNSNSGPTVVTTGNTLHDDYTEMGDEFYKNWNYRWSQTGGDAVKIVGGTLYIYGGSYTSAQGNGILVRKDSDSSDSKAYVYGGNFSGNDNYREQGNNLGFVVGPGASYAFKLLGGDLEIHNGTFSSAAGGAFAMEGTVNFYGGTIEARGATGFSAWEDADVNFTPSNNVAVRVSGASTGLAIETNTTVAPQVTISGGTFTGGGYYGITAGEGNNDGIWYGNGSATLEITGGTFQGDNRSGLYFGATPSGNNVRLSGGTYYGALNDVHMERNWMNIPECSNNTSYNAIDGNSNMEYRRIVVSGHTANGNTLYDRTINNGTDVADGECTTTTNGLTEIKNKGTAEVERYGVWYTAELVYSQVVIR